LSLYGNGNFGGNNNTNIMTNRNNTNNTNTTNTTNTTNNTNNTTRSDIHAKLNNITVPTTEPRVMKASFDTMARKHGTDKAHYHTFTEFYQKYLPDNPDDIKLIVEMGVADGKSLNLWREYFPHARVVGLDIDPKPFTDTFVCDGGDRASIEAALRLANINLESIDLFIDDGGHFMDQQQTTWLTVWPYLRKDAIFIMEDLHTSLCEHSNNFAFNPEKCISTLDIVYNLIDHKVKPLVDLRFESISKDIRNISLYTHFNPIDTSITALFNCAKQ